MLENSNIGQIIEMILFLLRKNDSQRWTIILKKLLHEYHNEQTRGKSVENILKIYQGGMGSFEDLVLQKNNKMLLEENDELEKLKDELYNACREYHQKW